MGNKQVKIKASTNYCMCPCGSYQKATYRCQFTKPQNVIMPYGEHIKSETLERIFPTDLQFVHILVRLRPYWSSSNSQVVRWIACDICLRSDLEEYFTLIPSGWTLENIKYDWDVEEIKYVRNRQEPKTDTIN